MKFCRTIVFLVLTLSLLSQAQKQATAVQNGPTSIHVDGVKYPITQDGIQQALDDACVRNRFGSYGMDVYLPPMVVPLTHKTGQQFLETCSLQIHGSGLFSTWFVVDDSVPENVPVFRIKPASSSSQSDMSFDNFRITSKAAAGGDAFLFDGSNPGIGGPNNFTIRKVMVTGLSANAWAINMTGQHFPKNQQGWNHISDNVLEHGIHLTNEQATDSWLIEHNMFGSATGGTTPCIDATTAHGASHITAFNNNGGCAGGFFISHGTTQCKILYNQIEQPAPSTEPNSAIIDLIGDNYPMDGCEIVGNNINAHDFADVNVRIGRASNTSIYDNVIFPRPKTGVAILLTASSSLTRIPFNHIPGANGAGYKNEGGASTFSVHGADGSASVPAFGFANERGTGLYRSGAGLIGIGVEGQKTMAISASGSSINSNAGYCHISAAAQSGSGGESCVNQIAPGVVGIGAKPGADKTALIQSGNTARVTADFTSRGSGMQSITGLRWNLPAAALTYSFHCALSYSQSAGNSQVAFGIASAGGPPAHAFANGSMQTGQTTFSGGTLADMSASSGQVVSGTPAAAQTDFVANLDGTIESGPAANALSITVGSANPVTIRRGSYCQLF